MLRPFSSLFRRYSYFALLIFQRLFMRFSNVLLPFSRSLSISVSGGIAVVCGQVLGELDSFAMLVACFDRENTITKSCYQKFAKLPERLNPTALLSISAGLSFVCMLYKAIKLVTGIVVRLCQGKRGKFSLNDTRIRVEPSVAFNSALALLSA
jgi:hypothetical protein